MSILFREVDHVNRPETLFRMPRGRLTGGMSGHPALDDNRPKGVMTAYAFFVQVHYLNGKNARTDDNERPSCRPAVRSTNATIPTRSSCSPISRRSAPTGGRQCRKRRRGGFVRYVHMREKNFDLFSSISNSNYHSRLDG